MPCSKRAPWVCSLSPHALGLGVESVFFEGTSQSTLERVVSMLVSIGGLLITALLIGFSNDQISSYMESLRDGKVVGL